MATTTPATQPHLVLLPGLMRDAAVWQAQIDALAEAAHCSVVDYGSLSSLRAMAEHVLATAPAPRFALAGHSMGGRVAFEVMRIAPQRVTRLALLDTAPTRCPMAKPGPLKRPVGNNPTRCRARWRHAAHLR